MSFRIAVKCCNYFYGESIKKLIEDESLNNDADIDSVDICTDFKEIVVARPNLVIADFKTVCKIISGDQFNYDVQLFLLGTGCLPTMENVHLLDFISKGLVGILPARSSLLQLKEAINKVLSGGVWFDQNKLRDILFCKSANSTEKNYILTKKEEEIAKLICRGLSNKEIMKELKISEQSVKSHLSRIYKKTGTSDRLQLALLTIKKTHELTHSIEECFDPCGLFSSFLTSNSRN